MTVSCLGMLFLRYLPRTFALRSVDERTHPRRSGRRGRVLSVASATSLCVAGRGVARGDGAHLVRFYIDVAAQEKELPWRHLHGAAHAVVYSLIREQDPAAAQALHDHGWQASSLRPVGVSPPVFTDAPRKRGSYMLSQNGRIWFGSPVSTLAGFLLASVAGRTELRWGTVTLTVKGVQLEPTGSGDESEVVLDTRSPVLVKRSVDRFLLPEDDGYVEALRQNIRHKADLLGLPGESEVDVLEAGPRRRYEVSGGLRIGATVKLRCAADPRLLIALREWGLGLGNIQGFGWVR